jgi:trimethylamine--corrinoid protein Co-methyltransferase
MPQIYDLEMGELRFSTIQDIRDSTRILDALPRVGPVCATLVEPTDVPPELSIIEGFEATLRNTAKPIIGPGPTNEAEARWALAVGSAIRGSQAALVEHPFFIPWLALMSPLAYGAPLVAAVRVLAHAGLPLAFVTNPMTALTAPLTLAGALAQMHAELLGAIVITQQVRPGTAVLYQGAATIADLYSLTAVKGRPETSLTLQAAVLLGRYRRLPTTSFGLNNTSKMMDVAYGYEKAMNGLTCMLAQPHILSGMGMLGNGVYAGHESLIIDHEIVGILWRLVEGIRVDEDTLGVGVVKEAMEGVDLITHQHTLAHLRTGEYWTPSLSDNLGLDEWLARGRPGALSRARDKARDILTNHTAPPLSAEADTRLKSAMMEAERELLPR